jgi:hypothetical protein
MDIRNEKKLTKNEFGTPGGGYSEKMRKAKKFKIDGEATLDEPCVMMKLLNYLILEDKWILSRRYAIWL